MQQKKPEILDQDFSKSDQLKVSRRKMSDAVQKICSWFNSEFRTPEQLPTEFKYFASQKEIDKNRARDLWQKYF